MDETGRLPTHLEVFVAGGGRVLVCAQKPNTLRDAFGLRVSYKAARYTFGVGTSPVTAGLTNNDLCDWAGKGTLVNPYPNYLKGALSKGRDTAFSPANFPYAGWRHGLQGTVSTAPIEKPHRAGWRPLLECEFDLAYSPLMEMDFGKGRIILCQLDIEDQIQTDPAAEILARQLLAYAENAPLSPRVPTVYFGNDSGAATLEALGLVYRRVTSLPTETSLLITGPDISPTKKSIVAFVRKGGRVLSLASEENGAVQQADFNGSLAVPNWPEARGLSVSDVHWRAPASSLRLVKTDDGEEIATDGLLSRRVIGRGILLTTAIAPNKIPADEKTYLRFTRWRQTRALTQIIANMGGSFLQDARLFHPQTADKTATIALDGVWKAQLLHRLPAAPTAEQGYPDAGISPETHKAITLGAWDTWASVAVPGVWEKFGGQWTDADGEALFVKTIDVPALFIGKESLLSLGTLDDNDDTFVNGVHVGGLGDKDTAAWSVPRRYTLKAGLLKPGKNVIAVRIWDRYGGGGFTGNPADMTLSLPSVAGKAKSGFYHPDYRTDFDLGDEPSRYFNW